MFDRQLLKINGAKKALAVCSVFSLLRAFSVLGEALSLSFAVVELWDGLSLGDVALALAVFAAFFLLREVLSFAQDAYIDGFASKSVARIQEGLLESIYEAGPALVRSKGIPATVALMVDGSDDVAQYIRIAFPKICDCVIVPVVLLASLFALDLISGIIALVCLPFIFIFMRLIGMTAKEEANKRHAQFEQLSNSFVNKVQGIVDLKSFGADGRFAKMVYSTSEAFRKITMRTLRVSMLSSAVLDLFATLALAGVAIMLGFRMVEGGVAFFPALCVLVLVPEYFKPVREFGSNYHDTLSGKESLRALSEMVDDARSESNHASPFWAASLACDTIEIDTSNPSSVAVTGASGAGKTTLLNALAGLADPQDGFKFVVDGEPASSLRNDAWRARVAYIPQDPHIFNVSIRDNVRFYCPGASDDEVRRALGSVGMLSLVDSLEDGLDTRIGEGGRALSGGQLARIALSRALVDGARDVLIMDEPSAHIDAATERELREAIEPIMEGKTSFVVTHSQDWAAKADRRLIVSNGAKGADAETPGNTIGEDAL